MKTEDILREYRKGDFHNRLNLYLEYRELRPLFMQIHLDKPCLPKAGVSEKKASRIMAAIGFITYKLSRCCSP